jgi:hypothetical protein
MTFKTREEALGALEIARADYLAKARNVAKEIAVSGDGTCTVNQVRAVLPPPDVIDGRVMGAIFNKSDWQNMGYVSSDRGICHKRPIALFKYKFL